MCKACQAAGLGVHRSLVIAVLATAALTIGQSPAAYGADSPKDPSKVENADAKTPAEMKPYTDVVANTDVTFDMVPIPGGKFVMGSPNGEPNHKADESPQHEVEISPFWMGKCEVTWDEYDVWTFALDVQRRQVFRGETTELEKQADAVTRPTKPYIDMSFGMGKYGFPAISMTQLAAKTYCKWLSQKTGRYYRLPTEAEWEYACRAGTTTAYSFGDDPAQLGDYRLVRRQQRRPLPQGRQEKAESLGSPRHARQRLRVDARRLYPQLSRVCRQAVGQPAGDFQKRVSQSGPRRRLDRRCRPACAAPPGWARTRIGNSRTRNFRKAYGISPTRSSSAFDSSVRWSSPRTKRKPKAGMPESTNRHASIGAPLITPAPRISPRPETRS